MTADRIALAVVGTAYHTPTPDRLEVLDDVVFAVTAEGTIEGVHAVGSPAAEQTMAGAADVIKEFNSQLAGLKTKDPKAILEATQSNLQAIVG